MKIKTLELTGAALDWAVAKCEGMSAEMLSEFDEGDWLYAGSRRYSTDWSQGGPIIERENIELERREDWTAKMCFQPVTRHEDGPTPLIAAMRCFCASKLGEEVEVPDELS